MLRLPARCPRGLRTEKLRDLGMGRTERGFASRGIDGEAFGVNELDVRHTDEAQEVAHVLGLCIKRAALVQAAACREHIGLLAGEQPDRALCGVAERVAGTCDVIEIGLQLRRNAEVVHR